MGRVVDSFPSSQVRIVEGCFPMVPGVAEGTFGRSSSFFFHLSTADDEEDTEGDEESPDPLGQGDILPEKDG